MAGGRSAQEERDRAAEVLPRLESWAERYPDMGGPRLKSMALSCAAASPQASAEAILQAATFCMVLFGIDDVADRTVGALSDEEVDAALLQYVAIARSGGEASGSLSLGPAGQVRGALQELCRTLFAADAGGARYRLFARHLEGMLEGMREEVVMGRVFAQRGELPAYEVYLEMGTRSVGIPPVGAVLLLGEPPSASTGAGLDALADPLLMAAARCIRVANDVRSYEREVREGKPNAVLLLMRQAGLTEAQAKHQLITTRDAEFASLPRLVEGLPLDLRPWGEAVRRYTGFIKDWYAVAELHDERPDSSPPSSKPHSPNR